jgi:hypothetical protein
MESPIWVRPPLGGEGYQRVAVSLIEGYDMFSESRGKGLSISRPYVRNHSWEERAINKMEPSLVLSHDFDFILFYWISIFAFKDVHFYFNLYNDLDQVLFIKLQL